MAKKVEKKEDKSNSRVNSALALLRKKFGDDAAMTFTDMSIAKVDVVSTGSVKIDRALGIGGFPFGRCVLVWGGFSSAKSTIALHTCANAQKMGKVVAYVDIEHALDPLYAENLGCKMDELILIQPSSAEEALGSIELLAKEKAADVIVLDSIAACVPTSELEQEIGSNSIGRQARIFSDFFKRVTPMIEKANCLLLCINQARQKPGVLYGSPDVRPGGVAQDYYSSIICKTSRLTSQTEKDNNGDIVANQIRIKVEKNKLAPPFRETEVVVYYGKGFDSETEKFDMAVDFGLIQKSGAFYKYNGETIGQGSTKAKAWLNEHLDIKENIMNKVTEILMKPVNEKIEDISNDTEEIALQTDKSELNYDPETGEIIED